MQSTIKQEFAEHLKIAKDTNERIGKNIETTAHVCINSLKRGGKIFLFGNGGSAADAQHIAAELVGRYKAERKALAAIALTTDTSIITSIGNDFGYSKVFERQIGAMANKNDVVIGISTSGNSINVINGLTIAKKIGCSVIGFSGNNGGEMNTLCDINLIIPSRDTARIQEMHILIGHTICHLIEQSFLA